MAALFYRHTNGGRLWHMVLASAPERALCGFTPDTPYCGGIPTARSRWGTLPQPALPPRVPICTRCVRVSESPRFQQRMAEHA